MSSSRVTKKRQGNAAAQARFRERRKAKTDGLEARVAELQHENENLRRNENGGERHLDQGPQTRARSPAMLDHITLCTSPEESPPRNFSPISSSQLEKACPEIPGQMARKLPRRLIESPYQHDPHETVDLYSGTIFDGTGQACALRQANQAELEHDFFSDFSAPVVAPNPMPANGPAMQEDLLFVPQVDCVQPDRGFLSASSGIDYTTKTDGSRSDGLSAIRSTMPPQEYGAMSRWNPPKPHVDSRQSISMAQVNSITNANTTQSDQYGPGLLAAFIGVTNRILVGPIDRLQGD